MIKVGFKRPVGWNSLGRKYVQQIKAQILADLEAGLRAVHESILRTPVYTGRTINNYRWSLDSPISETRAAVRSPALPGKTSEIRLGSEPRRAANVAQVEQEFKELLAALKRDPVRDIYLTNNTPYFTDVEYGTYKTSAGSKTRTPPGGMVRRGETLLEINVKLERRNTSV